MEAAERSHYAKWSARLVTLALLVGGCSISRTPEPEQGPSPADIKAKRERVADKIRGLQGHIQFEPKFSDQGSLSDAISIVNPENLKPMSPEVKKKVQNAVVKVSGSHKNSSSTTERGSGFLMFDENEYLPVVMTSGKLVSNLEPSSITVDSRNFQYNTYTAVQYSAEGGDNLAKLFLPEAQDFEATALKPRDLKKNELKHGEQLFAVTVQEDHEARTPAIYPLIYINRSSDDRFANVITAVDHKEKDDNFGLGVNGGMVVDLQGRVVGMISVPGAIPQQGECGDGPVTTTNGSYFESQGATIEMFVHEVGDICEPGDVPTVVQNSVRLVGDGGFEFIGPTKGW